ncbi:hypothetical protein D3C81_324170 [compost metagenome]
MNNYSSTAQSAGSYQTAEVIPIERLRQRGSTTQIGLPPIEETSITNAAINYAGTGIGGGSLSFFSQYSATEENNGFQGEGDLIMDESTKLLLERLERDSREREERYHKDAQEREERYREQMLEQDRRFRQDMKEREERIESAVKGISDDIADLKQDFTESKKHIQNLVTANVWGMIATVLAIVALTITVVLAGK